MSDGIRQEVEIAAPATKVYEALTNAEAFAGVTGAPAQIDARIGGAFSLFGDQIVGVNVAFSPGKRLVQAWRVAAWPEGVYSIVRFELDAKGDRTGLTLTQAGHPKDAQPMLEGGWSKMYWDPMNAKLSG